MKRTAGRRDSELVRQTAELLSAGGSLSDLFERLCLLLAQFVDASVVFIALDSVSGIHIEYAYDHGTCARDLHLPVLPESRSYRVMQSGEPLLLREPDDPPRQQAPLQLPGTSDDDTASAMFVPLRFASRPIGVLSVQSAKRAAYDERDLDLLQTCALYVAAGVQSHYAQPRDAGALAGIDAVTAVATRRVFDERLNEQWLRARRAGGPLAVILMDIDRFKAFNATYGHVAGDACLAQAAQAARSCVSRSRDLFARYGGEEFAALLTDVPPAVAIEIAERMRKAVAALRIPHAGSPDGFVTASFGVAYAHAFAENTSRLVRRADRALYAAKTGGRNRSVLESPQQIDEYPHAGGNLPAHGAGTVGRSVELDALARSLALSRLTTVVGPAGVGKTHCALAAGKRLVHAYVHGAWYFDLSLAADENDLDAVLSAGIGEQLGAYRRPRDAMLQYFAHKHCVIVLDGCDGVMRETSELCRGLLAQAPRATLLVTARQPMEIAGERAFHLSSLTRADAHALFCARAASASPGVIIEAQQRSIIDALCAELGDVPLAIELAAAQVKRLRPEQLGASLGRRPDRSLDATVAWSCDMLDERAQRVFERLSVFGHTFDPDAVRDVCGYAPLRPGEAAAAFDEILESALAAPAHVADRQRFVLLEPVRSLAARRLRERGEEPGMHLRHAQYYLAVARGVNIDAREWPEFRAALDRSFAGERASGIAIDLVLSLTDWWTGSGRIREARSWLDRALAAAPEDDPRRTELLYAAALAAQSDGDFFVLRRHASAMLALAELSEDRVKLGRACNALGNAEKHFGNTKAAQQWYTSALAHHRAAGDRSGAAVVQMNLGACADLQMDFPAARTYFLEALNVFEHVGPEQNAGIALANLGEIAGHVGDYENAIRYASESLGIFERLRNPCAQAWQLVSIAHYRIERQQWERAANALRGAHTILQEHPHREYAAMLLEVGLYLSGDLERDDLTARIAGYLQAYREREAVPRHPGAQRHYDGRVQRTRRRMGTPAFDAAYASGTACAPDALLAEIVRF